MTGKEGEMADEQRSAARRRQIFQATATVFARQGYHGARMDDIVKESGLSKGALYWYFKNKEELATGLVHQMLSAEKQGMDELMAAPRPAAERLEELVRGFARELTKDPEKAPLALELLSLAQNIPDIRACYSVHHEQYTECMRALLLEVCEAGPGVHDEAARRADAAALALASAVDGLALRWTLARTAFDLEEKLWEVVQVIVRGLLSSSAG